MVFDGVQLRLQGFSREGRRFLCSCSCDFALGCGGSFVVVRKVGPPVTRDKVGVYRRRRGRGGAGRRQTSC